MFFTTLHRTSISFQLNVWNYIFSVQDLQIYAKTKPLSEGRGYLQDALTEKWLHNRSVKYHRQESGVPEPVVFALQGAGSSAKRIIHFCQAEQTEWTRKNVGKLCNILAESCVVIAFSPNQTDVQAAGGCPCPCPCISAYCLRAKRGKCGEKLKSHLAYNCGFTYTRTHACTQTKATEWIWCENFCLAKKVWCLCIRPSSTCRLPPATCHLPPNYTSHLLNRCDNGNGNGNSSKTEAATKAKWITVTMTRTKAGTRFSR